MNKKGSILITVLIIVSLCTTVVLSIHERAVNSYGKISSLQSEYQGAIYAMTAIDAIKLAFQYDDANYDCEKDIWAVIPSIPVEKGFLNVTIKPISARFPMNALALSNDTERERYEEGFDKLTQKLEIQPNLQELKEWLGSVKTLSAEKIDEDNAPYNIKGESLDTMAELYYIPKYEDIAKKLSQYASIGEKDSNTYKINLNFASKEVITSLIPELEPFIDSIISKRSDQCLKNVSDIYEIMGGTAQSDYQSILPYFDVKSTLFYVKIELDISDDIKFYHILMRRNGSTITPIKYIEGNNIDYF